MSPAPRRTGHRTPYTGAPSRPVAQQAPMLLPIATPGTFAADQGRRHHGGGEARPAPTRPAGRARVTADRRRRRRPWRSPRARSSRTCRAPHPSRNRRRSRSARGRRASLRTALPSALRRSATGDVDHVRGLLHRVLVAERGREVRDVGTVVAGRSDVRRRRRPGSTPRSARSRMNRPRPSAGGDALAAGAAERQVDGRERAASRRPGRRQPERRAHRGDEVGVAEHHRRPAGAARHLIALDAVQSRRRRVGA